MGLKPKTLLIALGMVLVAGAAVGYVVTLPTAQIHRAPVARVTSSDPQAELAAQARAEGGYDSGEKAFGVAAKRAHAADTPVLDVCTGKPIKSGPMTEIRNPSTDCPPPTATKGAHDAIDALMHECVVTKHTPGATKRASAYLLRESRTRPTWELFDLLLDASYVEMEWCGGWNDLTLAGKFIDAAERVMETLRPTNRFLDGPNKRRQQKRDRRLNVALGRVR
jgi:hypothetical protein